ncbi:MAG: hypothetical protein RLZZ70_821 [Candidatus Parcubacteria bacterium]
MRAILYTITLISLSSPSAAEVRCFNFDIPKTKEYVVQKDDTLGGIAVRIADDFTSVEDLICINEAIEAKITKNWGNRPEPLGGPMWSHRLQPGDIVYIPVCAGGCTTQYGVRIN